MTYMKVKRQAEQAQAAMLGEGNEESKEEYEQKIAEKSEKQFMVVSIVCSTLSFLNLSAWRTLVQ